MVGAVGSAFIINDVATVLPRAVVAKAHAYLAGAAADVIEVSSYEDAILLNFINFLKPILNLILSGWHQN